MSALHLWTVAAAAAAGGWQTITETQRATAALARNPWLAAGHLLFSLAVVAALLTFLGLGLVYIERKVAAHFQCRLGPMRVGPHGLLQTAMDALKLLTKEDIVPDRADRALHLLAPFIVLATPVLVLGVLPYGPIEQLADVNIGVVFVAAVSGFGVIGVLLAGWSSHNKWSLIGAMRAGAQIISSGLSATLGLLLVVMYSGTVTLSGIVESQDAGWWVWRAPGVGLVGFLVYLVAGTAEVNRVPFDIPEGESELVAGFHTEYSGMRFSFFFLAEFVNLFTMSALAATLFLGGWMPFHIGTWSTLNELMDAIPAVIWFFGKTFAVVFLLMWVRWTFPRMRVDQLMRLEWKFLLPIGFANLLAGAVLLLAGWYFYPIL